MDRVVAASVTHQGICSARSHWPICVGKVNTQWNSWEPVFKQCFELKHLCDSEVVFFFWWDMNEPELKILA